jgi:hypothetical protein
MKKNISILLLSFFLLNQFFAQTNNDIVVFAEDPLPFYLILNGVKQNDKPETNVKIVGLNIDRANLKVVFENNSIAPISKNVWLAGVEGEVHDNMIVTLRIVKTKKAYKLKWFGEVGKNNVTTVNSQPTVATQTVQSPPTTTTVVTQTVQSPPPTTTVVQETVTTTTTTDNPENANVNVSMGGAGINMSVNVNENTNQQHVQQTNTNPENVSFNMSVNVNDNTGFDENANVNMNMNMNDGVSVNDNVNMNTNMNVSGVNMDDVETTSYNSTTTTTTTTTTGWAGDTQSTTTNTNSGWANGGNSATNTNSYAVNDCEVQNVNSVLNAIENESFKSDKMMVAKQATKSKCLSVDQIKQVMEKFTFEDSKLEFAKNAYSNCSNKDDYYLLNEAFTFSSSKSELNKYISNQ